MVRTRELEGFQSQAGSPVGPTSVACRAVRAGLGGEHRNSFSKDDMPSAADSNTNGLPLAEKAVEPRDERMTGSSDVSSLCCKVGFCVTLLPRSGPAIGASRVDSGRSKVNIQTIVPQTPHHQTVPPRRIGSVGVDGTRALLLLEASIACTPSLFLMKDYPVSNAAAVQSCCLVECLLRWGNGRDLGRDPSTMHSHPRSTLNNLLVWSLGEAAAFSTAAHDTMMRF